MLRRLAVAALLVASGLAAGLVLSGRLRLADESTAQQQPAPAPQPAPRAAAAAADGLPDFTRVAERSVRAIANISSTQVVRRSPVFAHPFFQDFFGNDEFFSPRGVNTSLGSGVVVSSDGYVLTNNHVLGENLRAVRDVTVSLGAGRDLAAKIVGIDPLTDMALLKIDTRGLTTLPWGDSSKLKVAQWVLAIGNPFQLNQTVTLGIVSALGRANVGVSQYEDFIQTDAAINPGNSGGALINAAGELVGINTAIYSQSGGYQGVGFAVPSNLARRVMEDLIRYGEVRRGWIGIVETVGMSSDVARQIGIDATEGVLVTRMRRDSSGWEAGIRPGDIILTFEEQDVRDPSHFIRLVSDARIGSSVRLGLLREGRRLTLSVPIEAPRR
jgi:Do/DeqQ family serine protease